MTQTTNRISELWRRRPKAWLVRASAVVVALLFVFALWQISGDWREVVSAKRWDNVTRFSKEVYPYALRDEPFRLVRIVDWGVAKFRQNGFEALLATFAISIVAISLAALGAFLTLFPASRNVASASPFLPSQSLNRTRHWFWRIVVRFMRTVFVLSRAIPEYVWAFLLIAILGPNAWPAILALAIHNFGILGKLGAEVVENTDPSVPTALRAKGLTRMQISAVALVPMSLSKWLLFFFYR